MIGRGLRWLASLPPRPSGHGARAPRLIVVRHHRAYAPQERPLVRLGVEVEVLRRQLASLARLGLVPVTVSEGLARLAAGRPGRTVALSFDDGYADNVELVLPLLREAGARATFFLTAGLIEERRAPWWDELEHLLASTRRAGVELDGRAWPLADRHGRTAALRAAVASFRVAPERQRVLLADLAERLDVHGPAPCRLAGWEACARLAEAGMEIGAHTLTHPFLSTLPPAAQAAEIGGSFELIERRLGLRPRGFAYPGGDHDATSVAAAAAAGAWAVTTQAGQNDPGTPLHRLRRRGLSEGACLGPTGRFSAHLMRAELEGVFEPLRARRRAAGGDGR